MQPTAITNGKLIRRRIGSHFVPRKDAVLQKKAPDISGAFDLRGQFGLSAAGRCTTHTALVALFHVVIINTFFRLLTAEIKFTKVVAKCDTV